jgi:hypothetical protein
MLTSEEKARLLQLIDHVELAEKCCDPENAAIDENGMLDFDVMCGECPYKGEECEGEEDPKRRDTWEAFRLARKAVEEEPARLLTVQEMRSLPVGAVVWEETHPNELPAGLYDPEERIDPMVKNAWNRIGNSDDDTGLGENEMNSYKGVFRWWSAKPTREQIEGTPWEEKEEKQREAD